MTKKTIIIGGFFFLSKLVNAQSCSIDDRSSSVSFHTHVNGISINGEYAIWYKCLPDPSSPTGDQYIIDNKITKAFIICEGFDPGDDNDLVDCYRHLDGDYFC